MAGEHGKDPRNVIDLVLLQPVAHLAGKRILGLIALVKGIKWGNEIKLLGNEALSRFARKEPCEEIDSLLLGLRIEIFVDGKNQTHPTDVNYTKGAIGISLTLKPDWRYDTIENDDKYGISIWHKDSSDKKVNIFYRTKPVGLCGTGLSTETVTIGNYTATVYRYDDLPDLFMTNFDTVSGGYYIENLSLPNTNQELAEIIDTLSLADTTITREEALKTAKSQTTREYTEEFANYDAFSGNWVVTLKNPEWFISDRSWTLDCLPVRASSTAWISAGVTPVSASMTAI